MHAENILLQNSSYSFYNDQLGVGAIIFPMIDKALHLVMHCSNNSTLIDKQMY